MASIYIGTAAWNIPKSFAHLFTADNAPVFPILKRYASQLNAVEINSSFYKDHQQKTYARWAETAPDDFRFSVKLSRKFTHEQKLEVSHQEIKISMEAIQGLDYKLGVLLIQLPPKQMFEAQVVMRFFDSIRSCFDGPIAIEPRHATWADRSVFQTLKNFSISKVYADPERCQVNDEICGWDRLKYYRLHGSPEIYKSSYDTKYLENLAHEIHRGEGETWCIFDNTQFGFATDNAITLQKLI